MENVFFNEFKGFLELIVPCIGFILPQNLEDRLTSGGEFGNKSADVL